MSLHRALLLLTSLAIMGVGPCFGDAELADLNLDGYVDEVDTGIVRGCLGDPSADPICERADLNGDGRVRGDDLARVSVYLGSILFDTSWPEFTPASIHVGGDGILYLHAPNLNRVYRWSIERQRQLKPIEIGASSRYLAYSLETDRLFIAYSQGAITQIDASYPAGEAAFARLSSTPYGLATAGNFVFAVDPSGAWDSHWIFGPDGALLDWEEWNHRSREYVWSPANQRMYFFRDDTSPNDLHWEGINPTTGAITGKGESPYHGAYAIVPPIRVSHDGSRVLLGSGDLYDGITLQIVGSVPVDFEDALWLADGSLLTLRDDAGGSLLEHWGPDRRLFNLQRYAGTALRVLETAGEFVVVTQRDGQPAFASYVPTNDADSDGVLNVDDAFPLDPAASLDSDGDGFPDAWNPGYGPGDSTEGLALDVFPQDSACWLAEHALPGQPDVCDIARAVPSYEPERIVVDGAGVVYLLSSANDRIFRWSLATNYHLNPIDVGDDPKHIAYSQENSRLYVGYASGEITQIDPTPASPVEEPFATTPGQIIGLQTAGRFVFAVDPSGAWVSHYTFTPQGTQISAVEWNYYSREITWSPANQRMYFFRDDTSPNDLHWEGINPTTGAISGKGESPYHGAYMMVPPIRVSYDGSRVVLGSGDLYDGITLQNVGSMPVDFEDALWLPDGSLLTLRNDAGSSLLEHWGPDRRLFNLQRYAGTALRVLETAGEFVVVTQRDGQPAFASYVPTDDADSDGVLNVDDAFPLDPAASLDSDGDGFPDAWNPGYGPEDSTEGLALDAFPDDSACQLAEHARPGQPGVCDIARAIPVYTPSRIEVDAAGTLYLLSPENDRIYRWSPAADYHLNPIDVGDDPKHIAYSQENGRLYVGYASGEITQIDPGAASLHEVPFTATPGPVTGLHTAGQYVFAADPSGAWASHYTFAPDGVRISAVDWNYSSIGYDWSAVNRRMYFTRDGFSPNDLHWESIDTAGRISGKGESPYHGDYAMVHPVRVSRDGAYVLLGSGDYYDGLTLEIEGSLPHALEDALWTSDGLITVRSDGAGGTWLEQWSSDFTLYNRARYPGEPLRVVEAAGEIALVTLMAGRPAFHDYVPTDDGDGDGVANADDAFPLDPAASLDSDGDGFPDAWNAGYGPEDSTEGLVLDAFPDDFACQTPAHGSGGVCDFVHVLPTSIDEPFCDVDTVRPAAGAGSLVLGATDDFVPLCDGWLMIGDVDHEQIAVRNAVNGRAGAFFSLPSAPGDLELDEQQKVLWVALPEQLALAVLDLLTGEIQVMPVGGAISSLAIGPDGGLIIAVRDYYSARLYWLARGSAAPVGGWSVNGTLIRWNAVFGELAVANVGLSPATLSRYSFNPASGTSLLQSSRAVGSNGQDLALSRDGLHLAFATGSGQGSYSIFDYVATNLASYRGAWPIGAYPSGVDFDRASARLLATNRTDLRVYDVATFAQRRSYRPAYCDYGGLSSVAFSRGGSLAFGKQTCGYRDDVTRYHWFLTE